ncbi:MAG: ATP phosphoribosyltransferase regulatory subunit, partial [Clostridia bacterium]|nr:ATP phosphoribosyltransferase regulatory subunit [Clostridia bacterium]
MSFDEKILNNCEKAIFLLRKLFKESGYEQYKVSKFEEYDLYMKNKNFLISDNVLTFTDTNGKLMALKPDVTLSIIKNTKDDEKLKKVYYNEVVYRPHDENGFREINQTGLECIGDIDTKNVCEVISLAILSLKQISDTYLLNISHNGFVAGLLNCANADNDTNSALLKAIAQRNTTQIELICKEKGIEDKICDALSKLCLIYEPIENAKDCIKNLILNDEMNEAYKEIEEIYNTLKKENMTDRVMLDFSIENDMNYYNGIIFNGFINELPQSVLAGGRYDNLLRKMGKNSRAIGFAVYLDMLERIDE